MSKLFQAYQIYSIPLCYKQITVFILENVFAVAVSSVAMNFAFLMNLQIAVDSACSFIRLIKQTRG